MFLPHPRVKVSTVGSLRDREVACSTSDRQGSNFELRILCLEDSVISIISPSSGGFSWPSLAYMCTKVASSPINFIYDLGQKRNTFKYQKILISQVWSTRKHTNHNVKLPCFIVKYTKYTLKMRSIRCMTTYWNSPHYICKSSFFFTRQTILIKLL